MGSPRRTSADCLAGAVTVGSGAGTVTAGCGAGAVTGASAAGAVAGDCGAEAGTVVSGAGAVAGVEDISQRNGFVEVVLAGEVPTYIHTFPYIVYTLMDILSSILYSYT